MSIVSWPSKITETQPFYYTVKVFSANLLSINYGDGSAPVLFDATGCTAYPCDFNLSYTYPSSGGRSIYTHQISFKDFTDPSYNGSTFTNNYLNKVATIKPPKIYLDMGNVPKVTYYLSASYSITHCSSNCSNNGRCILDEGTTWNCECFPYFIGNRFETL